MARMTWLVLAQVLGGVVLFLVGMQWLSTALRVAAGERLRTMLNAATASRPRGLALGTTVGFLAHSSAATVMTVGFVNAGLLSLAAALPVLFGANVGTTLSMQLISIRLTDYALVAVTVGGVLYLAVSDGRWRLTGQAILGAGLLFFGMKLSGEAIVPYREALTPLLAHVDGSTVGGMLIGVGLAALVTGIVQSSGAVIGMTFVLAGAGVFTSLWQTFPIVLGAHVGTTMTGVIAALGTSAEARRAALANVLFNVGNASLGMMLARVFVPLLQGTSTDLVHQTANAHTFIMLVAAVGLLPFTPALARVIQRRCWASAPAAAASFLDPRLRATPEDALVATLRELGRCAGLAIRSFQFIIDGWRTPAVPREMRLVRRNEQAINEIKASLRSYLGGLAREPLNHRQALVAQALNRCAVELERIGDHVDRLADLTTDDAQLFTDAPLRAELLSLADRALEVVTCAQASFTSEDYSFDEPTWETLAARNRFRTEGGPAKQTVTERLSRHEVPAARALTFSEIAATLERIVRHCAVIAQEQRQPSFAIDRGQLGQPGGGERPV